MSRKNKNKKLKKSFDIIVDGETESWYIRQLKNQEKENISVNLKPKLPSKKNLEYLYKQVKKLFEEENNKIFWIVDFDTIIKETKEAKKGTQTKLKQFIEYYKELSNNEKITIIINNPCLEYWFLQHYKQNDKYFSKYEELKKELRKHIKDYDKTKEFYHKGNGIYSLLKLDKKLKTAITNSKKLKDFGKIDNNNYEVGMAEMYKLFEELGIE